MFWYMLISINYELMFGLKKNILDIYVTPHCHRRRKHTMRLTSKRLHATLNTI
ncbi:unnamed protein product [Callosobruchus maculatus]|uniref:Uncharacterized protein n=1 Tax=Callosobruchus maculatus TaxID=64391 RepID=A0A653CMU9_CALMS|nr:unnamed protein product [Callosobruchus maculatus]